MMLETHFIDTAVHGSSPLYGQDGASFQAPRAIAGRGGSGGLEWMVRGLARSACLFDESGQLKTDRQMAAARAEQSEQRERDECEFHLVPLAAGQRRLKDEPTCTGPLQY